MGGWTTVDVILEAVEIGVVKSGWTTVESGSGGLTSEPSNPLETCGDPVGLAVTGSTSTVVCSDEVAPVEVANDGVELVGPEVVIVVVANK